MKARPAAAKDFCEHLLKTYFPNVYKSDNYIAYYNFCQQCINYFATARIKKASRILFTISFLQDHISFCY